MAEPYVDVSGPIFDGRAVRDMQSYVTTLEEDLAQEAADRIHVRLHQVLKHPTGYYESHIHIERQQDDLVVTDTPVVYGPWLEGVGSRNYPRTRFRGYATFRLVAQQLGRDAQDIADNLIIRYVEEMNA